MPRVDLISLYEGEPATIDDPNTALTNWNTASQKIDEDNVREEGITRRIIDYGAVRPTNGTSRIMSDANLLEGFSVSTSIDQTSPTANQPLLWNLNGGAPYLLGIGPLSLDTGTQTMEINFSANIVLRTGANASAIASAFKLIYLNSAVLTSFGWSDFASLGVGPNPTLRLHGFQEDTFHNETGFTLATNMDYVPLDQSLTISHVINQTFNTAHLYIGVYAYVVGTPTALSIHVTRATLEAHTWSA